MAVRAKRMIIGDKLFVMQDEKPKPSLNRAPQERVTHDAPTKRVREAPIEHKPAQERVTHEAPTKRVREAPMEHKPAQEQVELQLDEEPTVRTKGHSFILKSGSKFHRDMIE